MIPEDGVRIVLCDLDGTLMSPIDGNSRGFPRRVDDRDWIDGRLPILQGLRQAGYELAIVTNQGGAAYKILDPFDMYDFIYMKCRDAGLRIHLIEVCYHHPGAPGRMPTVTRFSGDSPLRKPHAGMLLNVLARSGYKIPQAIMIGNSPDDQGAAEALGMWYMDAELFFKQGVGAFLAAPELRGSDEVPLA